MLRTSGFCPQVRADLKYYRGATADLVVVQDPPRRKQFNLSVLQSQVLRQMNGKRDLDALTAIAQRIHASATRGDVEELTILVAGMGLLATVPGAPTRQPALAVIDGGQSTDRGVPGTPANDEDDSGDDGLGGDTVVESGAAKLAAAANLGRATPVTPATPPRRAATEHAPLPPRPPARPSAPQIQTPPPRRSAPIPVATPRVDPDLAAALDGAFDEATHIGAANIGQGPPPMQPPEPPPQIVDQSSPIHAQSAIHRVPDLTPSQPFTVQPGPGVAPRSSQPFTVQPGPGAEQRTSQPFMVQPGPGAEQRTSQPFMVQPGPGAAQRTSQQFIVQPGPGAEQRTSQQFVVQQADGRVTGPIPAARVSQPIPVQQPPGETGPVNYEIVKPRWYKRKRPRRLMYLAVFIGIITALGVIQYPLKITESCLLRPEAQVLVRAPVDGMLVEILVDEGELVKKGATIARFDDRKLGHEMSRARAEYDRLAANLGKMKSGSRPEEIKQAQALVSQRAQDVAFAKKEVTRVEKLYRGGDASQMEREERRREYSVKTAALAEAQAQLRLVKAGFRSEEVTIAEAELRKAKADVDYYEKQLSLLTITAPIDGRILTPRFRERLNERIAAGDPIVEIGRADKLRVEIMIPEREADVIAVGQPVKVKVHSFPLKPFNGTIAFIAPAVEEKAGQRFIRADAVIENPDGILQPRMTGYAEISAGEMSVLNRISRRLIRWVRVRFLI